MIMKYARVLSEGAFANSALKKEGIQCEFTRAEVGLLRGRCEYGKRSVAIGMEIQIAPDIIAILLSAPRLSAYSRGGNHASSSPKLTNQNMKTHKHPGAVCRHGKSFRKCLAAVLASLTFILAGLSHAADGAQSGSLSDGGERDFIFGVGTHWNGDQESLSEMKQAGVMSNRDDFQWKVCEITKGDVIVPESFGIYVDSCRANGISTVCILDYSNKFYEGGAYPRSAEAIEGFTRFAEAVVRNLKGKVKYYQIWNEWDGGCGMKGFGKGDAESYVKLLAAVYPRIKAIDPSAVILSTSICTGDAFLEKCLNLGMLKHCDAVSLHTYIYNNPGQTLETTWYQRMHGVDKMLRDANNGKEVPLYATEIGWPTHIKSNGYSEESSADSLARLYLLAISLDYIKGLWWYDFRDDGWDSSEVEQNFGMVRHDFTPKRSYFVYSDLTRYLKNTTWIERLDVNDPRVWIMKYKKDDGKIVVAAWSEDTDVDSQINFTNAAPASPEVSACHLGYGSLKRTFVKPDGSDQPALQLTLKGGRPWVLEGDLENIRVASITKRDFPESKRPLKTSSPTADHPAAASN